MNNTNDNMASGLSPWVSSFLLLGLLIAFFSMAFDRHNSAHFLYAVAVVGIAYWGLSLYRYREGKRILPNKRNDLIASAMVLMAVVQWWWIHTYGSNDAFLWLMIEGAEELKFWVAGAVLIFVLGRIRIVIPSVVRTTAIILSLLGCVTIASIAYYQYYLTGERIALKIGHPVPAGFIFALLLVVPFLLSCAKDVHRWLFLSIFIGVLSAAVSVYCTSTRGAFLLLGLFVLGVSVSYAGSSSIGRIKGAYTVRWLLVIIIVGTAAVFIPRFEQLYVDLNYYWHGDPSGSMGGRFVMWGAGLHSFIINPWGYTAVDRLDVVKNYIDTLLVHDPGTGDMIKQAAIHHLHDEVIEAMSLKGIPGLASVVLFYVSLMWSAVKNDHAPKIMTWIVAGIVLYGINEPILNSDKTVLCLVIILPFCLLIGEANDNAQSRYQEPLSE